MKKGFAISGLVYSILVVFLLLIFGVLGILGSRKLTLDKMQNSLMNELNNEIRDDIYKDKSGANYPRLLDRMIPVVYDDADNKWVYADIYEKWYDYDEKMWANAVVLKDGVAKTVGQQIEESEIALMYVWIPRFKYVVFNTNNNAVVEQEIKIIFESGTNSTGTIECHDAINQRDENGNIISEICNDITNSIIVDNVSTYTHPAFTFGDEQVYGFWIGKFENSTTDELCLGEANETNCNKNSHIIEIKPNADSLRYINISNLFYSTKNITTNYGIYNADSHMIKNMEWGALAYLTNSKYGRCINGICQEVTINNVSKNDITYTTQTGCAGNEISSKMSTFCENEYNTSKGSLASSTGNIYGVYDISGGANEYIMANMVDSSGNFNPGSSGFLTIDSKYYDSYSYDTSSKTLTRGKLGDATKETIKVLDDFNGAWYSDQNTFLHQTFSWFARGGYYGDEHYAGIFMSGAGNGDSLSNSRSTRSILIKK